MCTYSHKAVGVEQPEKLRGDACIIVPKQLDLVPDINFCVIACVIHFVEMPNQLIWLWWWW